MHFAETIEADQIAERFGTPLYVYDGDAIVRDAERLQERLERLPFRLLYSAKANPAASIARLLREAGLGLDACSPGDLALADVAGFEAQEISYTSHGATSNELAAAASRCGVVVLDGIGELQQFADVSSVRRAGLRLNPEVAAGFHDHVMAGASDAKFGLHAEPLARAVEMAGRLGLEIEGLHAHLGSDLLDAEPHLALLRQLEGLARRWPSVRWLNLGGGFGTPRRASDPTYDWESFVRGAAEILRTRQQGPIELRIEPGGHLLMPHGVLLTRVVDVRAASDVRPRTAVVDANTNHLVSILLYGAHHPVTLVSRRGSSGEEAQRIVGQLMQAGDVLASRVVLPSLAEGDLLTLGNAGAYASSRATTFNSRPRPAEVLVRDGRARLIRRAETLEDLFARDVRARA